MQTKRFNSDRTFQFRPGRLTPDIEAQTATSPGQTCRFRPGSFREDVQAQAAQSQPRARRSDSDRIYQLSPDNLKPDTPKPDSRAQTNLPENLCQLRPDIPAQTVRLQAGFSSSVRKPTISDQTSKVRPHPNIDLQVSDRTSKLRWDSHSNGLDNEIQTGCASPA